MRVSQFLIIIPVLLQVGVSLVVAAAYWSGKWQGRASERLEPVYASQFQLPVLFYAGCLFAYAMRIVDERVLLFATAFAVAQAVAAILGVSSASARTSASGGLISLLAAAGLWVMIGVHFFNSGF